MASDSHPADDIVKAVVGLFNGDNIRQTIREAWDRLPSLTPAPNRSVPDDTPEGQAVRDANKKFYDADAAERVRAKVKSRMK